MIEGIETLYQIIADSIEDTIPEAWIKATVEAIFFPSGSTYFGEYIRKSDGKARDFGTPRQCERAVRELREKFKAAGKPLWGQVYFELQCDGKFNMKWGYDNCDKNGDTIFNEDEEFKRHEERRKRLSST